MMQIYPQPRQYAGNKRRRGACHGEGKALCGAAGGALGMSGPFLAAVLRHKGVKGKEHGAGVNCDQSNPL